MKIRFLKPAQSEIDDAFAWYEAQSQGLGTQFLDDFDRAVRRIVAFPFAPVDVYVIANNQWHGYRSHARPIFVDTKRK